MHRLRLLCAFSILAVSLAAAETAAKIRVVLVGDSTVTDSAGWGLGFRRFLDESRVELTNTSQGGRSSMSFIKEGRWEKALALKADYYLIQFGHNDEPGKPGRSTTLDEYRDYMNRYVDEARAAGAKPVLVTSLVRRQFDKADDHKINSSLVQHVAIVKEIAAAKNVPVVDLHARSKALCEQLGREGCLAFSPTKIVDGQSAYDGTHLQGEGGVMFAQLVVAELRTAVPALAPVLLATPRAPASAATTDKADATVSADGSGTHTTVQSAVDAAPAGGTKPFVIHVKPGVYREHLVVPADRPFITLRGDTDEAAATVLTLGTNINTLGADGKKIPTPDSAVVLVRGANFTAENLTFENTTRPEERVQALAFYLTGDRAVLRRCRFLGWQDTLRPDSPRPDNTQPDAPRPNGGSRQYFSECYITGHVDFIYAAGTAVFERCHIHVLGDGWITAASTPQGAPFGFVFLDCRITAAPEVKRTYLGRPWRNYAAAAFLRCELPAQIDPAGWHNWDRAEAEKTVRYAEYQSTGPGANPAARVKWAHQLTDEEARAYTVENVLGGADRWSPAR